MLKDEIHQIDQLKYVVSSGLGISPFPSPTKSARKRKRKSLEKTSDYHHTFVMKLFDRSVDLAQFRDKDTRDTCPLYPVARAWIKNEPSNLTLAPRARSPTPDPDSDHDSDDVDQDVYHLPAPEPLPDNRTNIRVPTPPTVTRSRAGNKILRIFLLLTG